MFCTLILAILLFEGNFCCRTVVSTIVTYDSKALVIDGKRRILQSGSVHYPRTTPEVWPEIIRKAKEGGLDVIETYVFWNYHEPVKGEYYFGSRFDLVRFVKEVHVAGLFVHLRIGPYACAEWNYGGFPVWLHFISGIQFRTTNSLFKLFFECSPFSSFLMNQFTGSSFHVKHVSLSSSMQKEMEFFLAKIVNLMNDENLFASQGGPIILAQVENEYGNVEGAYGVGGVLYVNWAAETTVSLNTTVPWVMCAQADAPDPIINTCNGFYCDRFTPNSPFKPKMWTENYVGWFLTFGYAVPFRPIEDLAFANYYMYFGGTNFGRTAGGPLIATSYDYDAPINEYGLINQPKWGHLRDLHIAIKKCEEHLVNANSTQISLGDNHEVSFLANYDSSSDATVTFRGKSYFLPAWSMSILPDCVNVIFNTAKVGVWGNNSFDASGLLEQINTTRDISDFLWYTTSINMDEKIGQNETKEVGLFVGSLGHAALIFVNKRLVGFGYGIHDDASFMLSAKVNLRTGSNTIDVLSMMIGLQNYGPWFDVQRAGLYSVVLTGLTDSKEDLSSAQWTYQVGVEGDSIWTRGSTAIPINHTLTWYKTAFLAPEGKGPVSLNLSGMGKGEAWVNGQSIGRYWSSYLSPSSGCSEDCDYRGTYDASKCLKICGQPSQTLYLVPRSWLQPGENLLVIHEELGGDPTTISFVTRKGQRICSHVSDSDLPPVDTWEPSVGFGSTTPQLGLKCETGWRIASVLFASFGTPRGNCGASFYPGICHANVSSTVEQMCGGKQGCSIPVSTATLGVGDPCPNVRKSLAVEILCQN
ncbi:hypothetical protein ACP275_09G042400 [Erythranthe tilingii]